MATMVNVFKGYFTSRAWRQRKKKSVLYVYDETNSITLLKRITQREIDRYIQSMTLIFIVDYYK